MWAAVLGVMLCVTSGCVNVKPWEREHLSQDIMQPDRDPLGAAFSAHIYFSREAATGGQTVDAGGCGCN